MTNGAGSTCGSVAGDLYGCVRVVTVGRELHEATGKLLVFGGKGIHVGEGVARDIDGGSCGAAFEVDAAAAVGEHRVGDVCDSRMDIFDGVVVVDIVK